MKKWDDMGLPIKTVSGLCPSIYNTSNIYRRAEQYRLQIMKYIIYKKYLMLNDLAGVEFNCKHILTTG